MPVVGCGTNVQVTSRRWPHGPASRYHPKEFGCEGWTRTLRCVIVPSAGGLPEYVLLRDSDVGVSANLSR
eukprot:703747-Rhodomonas_salina.1